MIGEEPKRPSPGYTVKNGNIRYLSISQVVKFDPNEDGGCNRRWAFRYVFGKKEEETFAQRGGTEFAKQLEHYLKTGEDVLTPVLRAAKHLFPQPGPDLEVEKYLGDLNQAVALRDEFLKSGVKVDLTSVAGLAFCGIPFDGKADFRHRRGEYVDIDGSIRAEDSGMRVVEIGDLKTTSRINDHISSGGKIYKGWGKTVDQVLSHPQMVAYGIHASNIYPDATHIRLSHIYAQTKNGYHGAKRTGLLSVEEVRRRGGRIESLVREMMDVAKVSRPEDVAPNIRSCKAFNKDCPHAAYCDRPAGTFADLLQITTAPTESTKSTKASSEVTTYKGDSMGLFEEMRNNSNGTKTSTALPPLPPQTSTSVPQPPTQTSAPQAPTSTSAPQLPTPTVDTLVVARMKIQQGTLRDAGNGNVYDKEGADSGFILRHMTEVEKAAFAAEIPKTREEFLKFAREAGGFPTGALATTEVPTVPLSIAAINPADAPPVDMVAAAAPLPPEVIATIEDAEIKQRAETHAQMSAARAAVDPKEKKGKCSFVGTVVPVTQKEATTRKKKCPVCNADFKLKDKDFTEDFSSIVVPKHKKPDLEAHSDETLKEFEEKDLGDDIKASGTAVVITPQVPLTPQVPPPLPAAMYTCLPLITSSDSTIMPSVPFTISVPEAASSPPIINPPVFTDVLVEKSPPIVTTSPEEKITLYIDVVVERGETPTNLDDYINDMVKTLETSAKLSDLRYAPSNHELGFGRWRGSLAACVRYDPPKPGKYLVYGVKESEIKQVVVEALVPLCETVYRSR